MLMQRILTGLVLAGSVIALILYTPPVALASVFALVILAAAWEWAGLAGWSRRGEKFAYVAFIFALLLSGAAAVAPAWVVDAAALTALLTASCLGWVAIAALVVNYPRGTAVWSGLWPLSLLGGILLMPPWLALIYLRAQVHGDWLVIYAIAAIAIADIGAYFAGRGIGGPKLLPSVSPGKTWAGLLGGIIACCVYAGVVGAVFGLDGTRLLQWIVIGGATALISVFGDLAESMVKRQCGLKDSGSLLPGHGGLFDRIDAMTAGLPALTLGWLLAGGFWS